MSEKYPRQILLTNQRDPRYNGIWYRASVVEELEAENERLRWFYDNMRMVDRLNLQMVHEAEHPGAAAQEIEEEK